MKVFKSFMLAMGLLSLSTTVCSQAFAHGTVCAVMYEDSNYSNHAYIIWGLNANSTYVGDSWNDKVSSVYVAPGCQLTLYQDSNYQGLPQTYTQSAAFVGSEFNDKASSFKCTCRY